MNRTCVNIAILGLAAVAPAWAVSLEATQPAQPIPADGAQSATPMAIETWTAGSASLVPLMAADTQAGQFEKVDAPSTGGTPGKSVDDVAFVKQATDSGRKEVASARDALPQLKKPELKRIAEMLVNDHGNANAKLSKIAESRGWPVPAPAAAPAGLGHRQQRLRHEVDRRDDRRPPEIDCAVPRPGAQRRRPGAARLCARHAAHHRTSPGRTGEFAEMTGTEGKMLTMRIVKLLGIAGVAVLAAAWMAARVQRREEEERHRLNERLEKERWESEGGASRSGPATQSAVTAH